MSCSIHFNTIKEPASCWIWKRIQFSKWSISFAPIAYQKEIWANRWRLCGWIADDFDSICVDFIPERMELCYIIDPPFQADCGCSFVVSTEPDILGWRYVRWDFVELMKWFEYIYSPTRSSINHNDDVFFWGCKILPATFVYVNRSLIREERLAFRNIGPCYTPSIIKVFETEAGCENARQ